MEEFRHNTDKVKCQITTLKLTILSNFLFSCRSLGEFGGETLYDSIKDGDTTRVFAMIILVSLIFFGTITMINLFIAVIISDIKDLQNETFTQNLINMAHAAITTESVLPDKFLRRFKTQTKTKITLCLHDLCSEEICQKDKVPENFDQILSDIKDKIAEGSIRVKKMEKLDIDKESL